MTDYDGLAYVYDQHFTRPVDRWEDERLTDLLAMNVKDQIVVDLGAGTGWLADHCEPARYIAVDASGPMLNRLTEKHPDALTVKAQVGVAGWAEQVRLWLGRGWSGMPHVITATWAAHEFLPLDTVLVDCSTILARGGLILLHGQAPRYAHRDHYILDGDDHRQGYLDWTPSACERAGTAAGLTWLGATGTGATPDRLARTRRLWDAGLHIPARWHYAFLAAWRRP